METQQTQRLVMYLRDGPIKVQRYGMASGLFWLRSYISKGCTPPVDMVLELDYDFFFGRSAVPFWLQP